MRHNYILLFIICLLIAAPVSSQGGGETRSESLSFMGISTNDQMVQIDYSIPFGGVVEIHLFDGQGERVWYNTYARDAGAYSIWMKRTAFRTGEAYSFQLKYKQSEYFGEVVL